MPDNDTSTAQVDALLGRMQKLWGPFPQQPARDRRMVDHNGYANGQYRALQTDVDNLKTNFSDLRHDMDARFTTLSNEIKGLAASFSERFDKLFESQSNNRPDILKMAGVASVALVVVGGFASLAKTNLDTNIVFTNEKIATSNTVIKENFASTNSSIVDVAQAVRKLVDTTVPRAELDNRLTRDEAVVSNKVSKDVLAEIVKTYDAEIGMLRADLGRLRIDLVSRAEHEQHWRQYEDRLSLISNRLTEVAKATTGTSATDQIKQLQENLQALQNRFLIAPMATLQTAPASQARP